MNRATLTAAYLDEVKRRGLQAHELIGSQADADYLNIFYGGKYLSRPLFLGTEECAQLHGDMENLRSALISIPDRLFGGDLAAFARAVGMTDVQVSAIMRSRGTAVTRLTRADLYLSEAGFQMMEFNMGGAIGGIDNADMARSLLEHPVLAEFAETHRLEYVDSMAEQVKTIKLESGFPLDSRPMMVMTDWPTSWETLGPYIQVYTGRLSERGLDACGAHIGQLEVRDGGVWLGDKKVDIVYRMWLIEDLLENEEAPALLDPILDAVARGEVRLFTAMDDDLFASKGALAMLSDEKNRSAFSAEELASLDRILPWTRMVRPGPVTLEDGRQVDLLDYVLTHRHDLALKPTALHGGIGVLLGWRDDTSPEMWEEQVRAALDGPFVIQRRIRAVPELFPADEGDPEPWLVCWGAFLMASGYGGVFARARTIESNEEILNVGQGAYSGSCLHVRSD
ncbi:MAG TPA: hypothetical protein VGS62_10160 [Streptosporangiaceae bacterium]|nr:hypothetical protein [Streptosporangiaceae bacterium]